MQLPFYMVTLRHSTELDRQFITEHLNRENITDVYIIDTEGKQCGLLEMIQHEDSIKVEYIFVLPEYRDRHLGTHTIRLLQETYAEHEIHGNCLPNETSYYFWESLCAEFYMEEEFEFYRECNE